MLKLSWGQNFNLGLGLWLWFGLSFQQLGLLFDLGLETISSTLAFFLGLKYLSLVMALALHNCSRSHSSGLGFCLELMVLAMTSSLPSVDITGIYVSLYGIGWINVWVGWCLSIIVTGSWAVIKLLITLSVTVACMKLEATLVSTLLCAIRHNCLHVKCCLFAEHSSYLWIMLSLNNLKS